MRVLIVTPTFGAFGGLETYVFGLSEALAKDPRFEVRLVLKTPRPITLRPEMQVAIGAAKHPVAIVRSSSRELANEIKRADLVHLQNYSADVGVLSRALKKSLVVTVHGHRPPQPPPRMAAGELACRHAVARWYNSDFTMRSWEGVTQRPTSAVVSLRIPQGVEPAPTHQRRGFVFAARWIENKGLEALLDAYGRADINREEWPLVLLGDGPLRDRVTDQLDTLAPHVKTPGFVSPEEKTEYIRAARWLIAPPKTNEDLGLTPIEARELGVPCIVTRDGGLPEAAGPFSLQCAPGRTDHLSALMEFASAMSEEDYSRMATGARSTLLTDFAPLAAHLDMYLGVA